MKVGSIENCSSNGKIIGFSTNYAFNFGGLVGSNYGTINNCFNNADIEGYITDSSTVDCELRLGGICGSVEENQELLNCYNNGKISVISNVSCNSLANYYVGGICGKQNGNIKNCYAVGGFEKNIDSYKRLYIGKITGMARATREKIYSLNNAIATYVDEAIIKAESEMKSADFVDLLNEGLETAIWKKDTGINNGYPILYWQ